tara:strand:+ start:46 stop:174 length:129 start_codon:yes stop_codon:yes gene_type:complete
MMKKIFITFFVFVLITSCGKKSDPIYNEKQEKPQNTKLKVML